MGQSESRSGCLWVQQVENDKIPPWPALYGLLPPNTSQRRKTVASTETFFYLFPRRLPFFQDPLSRPPSPSTSHLADDREIMHIATEGNCVLADRATRMRVCPRTDTIKPSAEFVRLSYVLVHSWLRRFSFRLRA